ncbi:MAG: hypothetical protein AAF126_01985 [Chloroflexota bacterium]
MALAILTNRHGQHSILNVWRKGDDYQWLEASVTKSMHAFGDETKVHPTEYELFRAARFFDANRTRRGRLVGNRSDAVGQLLKVLPDAQHVYAKTQRNRVVRRIAVINALVSTQHTQATRKIA